MDNFEIFATAVRERFNFLCTNNVLYRVDVTGNELKELYLSSFPEGTNPIFRERTEHDCSCCRSFIHNIGNVVAIVNGKVVNVWAIGNYGLPYPYNEVAEAMFDRISEAKIVDFASFNEHKYGAQHTTEIREDNTTKVWPHFHAAIPHNLISSGSHFTTRFNMVCRALTELDLHSLNTMLELIDANQLYRGEEFRPAVKAMQDALIKYTRLKPSEEHVFKVMQVGTPVETFRNSAIGTLAVDLSSGMDLDAAVRVYENKVAPQNYKRTQSIITPMMVDRAMSKLKDLGLEQAVHRRLAKLSDVSVHDVIWADSTAQSEMKDSLTDTLMKEASKSRSVRPGKAAKHIGIEEFIREVLPVAESFDVVVDNFHIPNMMTVTAPKYSGVGPLFKWDNNFAWSYRGDVTDSIKERVKRAGGNVDAKVRFSLAWENTDDLDIHIQCPHGHIYFGNKLRILDVDMNVHGESTEPVENMSFVAPRDGVYRVYVNNYRRRNAADSGFSIEVDNNGEITQRHCAVSPRDGGNIDVGTFVIENGRIVKAEFSSNMGAGGFSTEVWGLKTHTSHRVSAVMYSPNHWHNNSAGNRHYFFIIDDCKVDEPVRGVYNEYLRTELYEHRKVFEILGEKTKCEPVDDQLSGLGFSSTKPSMINATVKMNGQTVFYTIRF